MFMPNLTRTQTRSPVASAKNRTKVLLVRQPVKSVRKSDEADPTAVRLFIGVIVAVGVVGALWLMGYLGFRLGFAPLVRVPDLSVDAGGGILTGVMMLIAMPQVILQAGLGQTGLMMAGFFLIAIPGASLGAIQPSAPGGPKPKLATLIISYTGAIFAMLNGIALLWWTASPTRAGFIAPLPADPAEAAKWLEGLQTVSGLDVLGTMSAALWVVVTMRLRVPLWLKGLSASACMFTLVVVAVAMSMSNGAASQIAAERSVFFLDEGSPEDRLVLGYTPQAQAALSVRDYKSAVEVRDRPAVLKVVGTQSIVQYLKERQQPDPFATP